ncbi:MAG: ribbon-helix-helix protein, CopG family [Deltaproteobacteria bacterium]|nr:MAG: ribbon-helix-helix protein, CopG family [Deltaproteobacteria bacterium]
MKVKTSITLSEDLLRSIDELTKDFKNRSDVIEQALKEFVHKKLKEIRDEKDRQILNKKARQLNEEASDVLGYQADW